MKTMYMALERLKMVPVVSKVATTSGEADKMLVEEIGARKEQKLSTLTMTILRWGVNLS